MTIPCQEESPKEAVDPSKAMPDKCLDHLPAERPHDEDILAYHRSVCEQEAQKSEYIGDKEPLTALATEYELGNPIFKAKVEEHILETKNEAEVDRVLKCIEKCRQTLISLGYAEFTFEDFLAIFVEQLESVLPGRPTSISIDTLVERCRDPYVSDYVVMFFRFVTSSEIRRRADFFEPFIFGVNHISVQQFCKTSVEPMGEESDHLHIAALTDAVGVPVRVVYLDRSVGDPGKTTEVNHHDFIPSGSEASNQQVTPSVVLLYRPGHYDILYPKVQL